MLYPNCKTYIYTNSEHGAWISCNRVHTTNIFFLNQKGKNTQGYIKRTNAQTAVDHSELAVHGIKHFSIFCHYQRSKCFYFCSILWPFHFFTCTVTNCHRIIVFYIYCWQNPVVTLVKTEKTTRMSNHKRRAKLQCFEIKFVFKISIHYFQLESLSTWWSGNNFIWISLKNPLPTFS